MYNFAFIVMSWKKIFGGIYWFVFNVFKLLLKAGNLCINLTEVNLGNLENAGPEDAYGKAVLDLQQNFMDARTFLQLNTEKVKTTGQQAKDRTRGRSRTRTYRKPDLTVYLYRYKLLD